MLAIPTQFPAAGSVGFLSPSAEEVRIIRRNADGTFLVSRKTPGASGTLTAPADDVFETEAEASNPAQWSRKVAPWRKVVTTGRVTQHWPMQRKQLLECGHHYVVKGPKACTEAPSITRRRCRECGQ